MSIITSNLGGDFTENPEVADDDSVAYDIVEEISQNRREHTHEDNHDDHQTQRIVLPAAVQKRKEALNLGMKVAYKNFTAQQRISGAVIGPVHTSINAWDYLPEGYDPAKDKPAPPKHKARRSIARPGHTKNAPTVRRPLAARQESLAFKRMISRPKAADTEEAERAEWFEGLTHEEAPDDQAAAKAIAKQREDIAELVCEHRAEEEEEAWEEEQQSLRESEEQKAIVVAAMKRRLVRVFLTLPSACKYLDRLHKAFGTLRLQRKTCAIQIQQFHQRHVKRFIATRYWNSVKWPLRFVIGSRVIRKRIAARRLASFLRDYNTVPMIVHMRSFSEHVRKSMKQIRGFLAVNRARKELVVRMWTKHEVLVRKHIAIKEAKMAEKLKREQKERLLAQAKNSKNGRGAGNTHAKWLAKREEVRLLLARTDSVQGQYRASKTGHEPLFARSTR